MAILGPDGRQCGACGCTSLQGCQVEVDGELVPCWWVAEDLCSACDVDECDGAGCADEDYA